MHTVITSYFLPAHFHNRLIRLILNDILLCSPDPAEGAEPWRLQADPGHGGEQQYCQVGAPGRVGTIIV